MQDLPMLRMQESEVNSLGYPSSSAGRVGGAHWGEWKVRMLTEKQGSDVQRSGENV